MSRSCVDALYATDPGTAVPEPLVNVKATDEADTASENTAAGATLVGTLVDPPAGFITVTVGGFVSAVRGGERHVDPVVRGVVGRCGGIPRRRRKHPVVTARSAQRTTRISAGEDAALSE